MRRRTFLLAGLGAGGALFLGWSLTPPRQRLRGKAAPELPRGAVTMNGWLAIAPDDTVTVVVPKGDVGQGIHTAIAMLVAEELACDWDRVRVVHSGVDAIYNNIAIVVEGLPFHPDTHRDPLVRGVRWMSAKFMREFGVNLTGGSSSLRDCWEVARLAGATARTALVETAAAAWGVDAATCRADKGVVTSARGSRRYGELAAAAATRAPGTVALKAPTAFTRIGRETPRLDAREKATGRAVFGIDIAVPGMKYAAVALPPTLCSEPIRFDANAASRLSGVRAVVPLAGSRYGDTPAVAVVADSWWEAQQGVRALGVQWSASPHAPLSMAGLMETLRAQALTNDGLPIHDHGDVEQRLASADRTVDVVYDAPYLAHAPLEPMNATVRVDDTGVDCWVGTQVPTFVTWALAEVTGVDAARIRLHHAAMGGSFGRRLEVDVIAQAAAIAKTVPGVPVQLLWTREDDMRHDFYRPAAVAHLRGAIDAQSRVTGIAIHSAGQAPFKAIGERIEIPSPRWVPDTATIEGTWDQPYEFAAVRAAHAICDLPVPVGSWRAVGHSYHGFFLESFLDELATATATDSLAFRLGLLAEHPHAAAVLRAAAERAGWGTPLAPTADGRPRARGIALHTSFGTTVAQVAEVSISTEQQIRVHRVTCAIDCGLPVNPSGIRQQVEGGIIFGLSAALRGAIVVDGGRVLQGNFDGYPPLRMADTPVIDTIIMPSAEPPSGVGEPPVPPVAAAVGNAVFALTGTRLRSLPLRLPPLQRIGGATP